ncbi:MAG: fibronectin type III domain-containing protein [Thermoanaerobaculia bacterium]
MLALAAAALAGCGKKGDPMPPPSPVPQPVSDLTVRQRGEEALIEFGYPKSTVSGLTLSGLAEVELWDLARPAATAALSPSVDPREYEHTAQRVATLAGSELASAIAGHRVALRFRLEGLPSRAEAPPVPAAPAPAATAAPAPNPATASAPTPPPAPAAPLPPSIPKVGTAHLYSVRTKAKVGEPSAYSNLVLLVPTAAASPPTGVEARATATGVALSWSASPDAAGGYSIYRRDADRPTFGAPLALVEAGETARVDTTAVFGKRYIYAVGAIASRTPPIESGFSEEREIRFEDRFAPPSPARLTALGSAGEVRLVWEASAASDVAGYVVERQDAAATDSPWVRLTKAPVAGLEYTDRGLASGATVRYRVAAIDGNGNLGEPSTPTETRVP